MILLLLGCVTLDAFVFNGVHCSRVGPETCTGEPWNQLCATCDEEYVWDTEYPWFPEMLEDGEDVRGIPASGVVREVLPSSDGLAELDTYWIPSHGEDPAVADLTILYNHGNFGGIEHYRPRLRVLHELGFGVFVWDYRGYGKTEPAEHPTPEQFLADARQVREHVDTVVPDPERVAIYGYSLGGIPAVEGAVHQPGCVLLLEAPFTGFGSAAAISGVAIPDTYLSQGGFDNVRKVEGYPGPLFAMVGELDGRFPPEGVRQIVDAAPGPSELWVLPGVEHGISNGGVVEAGMRAYRDQMVGFMERSAPGCLR